MVIVDSRERDVNAVRALKYSRSVTNLPLVDTKRMIDSVYLGGSFSIDLDSIEVAERFAEELCKAGFNAKQVCRDDI